MDKHYFNQNYKISYLIDIFLKLGKYKKENKKSILFNSIDPDILNNQVYFHIKNIKEFSIFLRTITDNSSIDNDLFMQCLNKFKSYIVKKERLAYLKETMNDVISDIAYRQYSNGYIRKILDKYFIFCDLFNVEPTLLLYKKIDRQNNLVKKFTLFLTNKEEDFNNSKLYSMSQNIKNNTYPYMHLYDELLKYDITWIEFSLIFDDNYFSKYKKSDPLLCHTKIKNLICLINDTMLCSYINEDKKNYLEKIYFDLSLSLPKKALSNKKI